MTCCLEHRKSVTGSVIINLGSVIWHVMIENLKLREWTMNHLFIWIKKFNFNFDNLFDYDWN